ncbi:unnamed protein product [Closterium sp. NIES-53]
MEGQDDNYATTSDIASLRTDMEQKEATLRRLEAFLTSQPGFATAAAATTATAAPTTPAAVATPTFHGPMAPLSPNLEAARPRLPEAFDPSAKGSDVRRFVATLEIYFEAIGCSTRNTTQQGFGSQRHCYYTQQMELLFNRITDLTEGEKIQAYTEGLKMEIRRQGVHVDPRKIEAVKKWKVPENMKELQQFLGFTNYYNRFVPQYAKIAAPLTDLLKKDTPFKWDTPHQQAME